MINKKFTYLFSLLSKVMGVALLCCNIAYPALSPLVGQSIIVQLGLINDTLSKLVSINERFWDDTSIDLDVVAQNTVMLPLVKLDLLDECSISNSSGEVSCTIGGNAHTALQEAIITLRPYYIEQDGSVQQFEDRLLLPGEGGASASQTDIVGYQCTIEARQVFNVHATIGGAIDVFYILPKSGPLGQYCQNAFEVVEDEEEES